MRLRINSTQGKIYSNITLEEAMQLSVKAKQQNCNTTN